MSEPLRRIVLIDGDEDGRALLTGRLRSLGFEVDVAADAASGAELALASPPAAVIADLWMAGISGVQLCRLLRAEAGTADVPIILRAAQDDPRSRFWAEQAGAAAFVLKGRMGDLARVLRNVTERAAVDDAFFIHLSGGSLDIRDRIAQHLDAALFESVIAAEVRALGSACSFARLFDAFSQLAARLMTYRWLAIATTSPCRLAVHSHPRHADAVEQEVRTTLGIDVAVPLLQIKDADAIELAAGERVHIRELTFGGTRMGRIAVSGPEVPFDHGLPDLVGLLGRELGGAIRMTTLVEQAQRLATRDPLTDLLNRRAFHDATVIELSRAERCGSNVAMLLLDVDHFKSINDRFGHPSGDAVLAALGKVLPRSVRPYDTVARWGGEEFVVLLPGTDAESAMRVAERIRSEIARIELAVTGNDALGFTASIGVAAWVPGQSPEMLVERADQAMYVAKTSGRNRVALAASTASREPAATQAA